MNKTLNVLHKELEVAFVASFSALAVVLHIFQYPFPPAPWLKFDLAGVPIAILFLISMRTGFISIPIFWLGSIVLTGDPTRIVGPSMKVLAELSTALPFATTYKWFTARRYGRAMATSIAFVVALMCRVLTMLLFNYFIGPYWLVWAGIMKTLDVAYMFIITYLPWNAVFNIIVVCYVVPISIAVWGIIRRYVFSR